MMCWGIDRRPRSIVTSSQKPPAKKTAAKKAAAKKAPAKVLGTSSGEYAASGMAARNAPPEDVAAPQPNNPAMNLFAAAQAAAQRQGGNVAAHATGSQVAQSKPVRLEVKINGKTRYAKTVYEPQFDEDVDAGTLTITADLNPTMVEPPPLPPPTRFYDQADERDGEAVIMRVHSGRRDIAEAGYDPEKFDG